MAKITFEESFKLADAGFRTAMAEQMKKDTARVQASKPGTPIPGKETQLKPAGQ